MFSFLYSIPIPMTRPLSLPFSLWVATSAIDFLERLVSVVIYYVSSKTLNPTNSSQFTPFSLVPRDLPHSHSQCTLLAEINNPPVFVAFKYNSTSTGVVLQLPHLYILRVVLAVSSTKFFLCDPSLSVSSSRDCRPTYNKHRHQFKIFASLLDKMVLRLWPTVNKFLGLR